MSKYLWIPAFEALSLNTSRRDNLMIRFLISCLFIVLICPNGAYAMGKVYLFSEVRGRVLAGGAPVAGAAVHREYHWSWGKEKKSDTAVTNEEGEFRFPEITGRSLSATIVPHQPVIQQHIWITYSGKDYIAWTFTRMNYEKNSETKSMYAHYNPIITIDCSLDKPSGLKVLSPSSEVFGICEIK
jgi:hypothetical protein